ACTAHPRHPTPPPPPAGGPHRPGPAPALHPWLQEADLLITVGYDLVEWSPDLWNPHNEKKIVHIDSTPAEVDDHYLPAIEVVGEIGDALHDLASLCSELSPKSKVQSPKSRPEDFGPERSENSM